VEVVRLYVGFSLRGKNLTDTRYDESAEPKVGHMTCRTALFGTVDWLEIVGEEMINGIRRNPPLSDFCISFIERYRGGSAIEERLVYGFRADVCGHDLTFQIGVGGDELADVTIDADIDAVGVLAKLLSTDPTYAESMNRFAESGAFRIAGRLDELGAWTAGVHDAICDRTR
jgi:hypothetical protein